jgi:hypothetical protein
VLIFLDEIPDVSQYEHAHTHRYFCNFEGQICRLGEPTFVFITSAQLITSLVSFQLKPEKEHERFCPKNITVNSGIFCDLGKMSRKSLRTFLELPVQKMLRENP